MRSARPLPSRPHFCRGTLGILLLALALIGIAGGDYAVLGVGIWSALLVPAFIVAVALSSGYAARSSWKVPGHRQRKPAETSEEREGEDQDLATVALKAAVVALVLLVAGFVLSRSGDALATQTGLGTGLVGFVLVGLGTSLPEISSVVGAIRRHNYELAIGDVFGTNLFDVVLITVADAIYRKGAILNEAGPFEMVAALLGIVLTAVYIIGLLERRDRTILRMGYDSLAAIAFYATGLVVLYSLSG
jgi:cation:H+ antiporter